MADKKAKDQKVKGKPSTVNDQLGENVGEGRIIRENTKAGKCR